MGRSKVRRALAPGKDLGHQAHRPLAARPLPLAARPRLVCLFSPQADALKPLNLDQDKWFWYENDAQNEPENRTYEPPTEIKLFYSILRRA